MVKITYKHWTKGHELEIIGVMPTHLNNRISDRFIIKTLSGEFEDIIKDTVIRVEDYESTNRL